MKKLISTLCTSTMLLGAAAPAIATFTWTGELTSEFTAYEDFSQNGTINGRSVSGGAATWSKSGRGIGSSGGIMTVSSKATGINGDTQNKETSAVITLATPISSGCAVVDFDFNISEIEQGSGVNFYASDSSGKNIMRIQADYRTDSGPLWIYTYKSGRQTLASPLDTSKTYSISIVYDFTNATMDFYVDNALLLADAPFYNGNNAAGVNLSQLMIYTGFKNDATATVNISNVKIGSLTDKLAMHYDSYYSAPTADNWDDLTSLTLPTTTKYDSTAAWASSNTGVIANDGTINTSNALVTGSDVTLTESYTKGGSTYSRIYDATVYGSAYDSSWTVCDFFRANSATSINGKVSDTGSAVWSKTGYGAPTYSNGELTIASSAVGSEEENAGSPPIATLTLADRLDTDVSVEFDIRINAAGDKPMIYFSDSGSDLHFARIQGDVANGKTHLFVYDGNGAKTPLVTNMEPGTWYTLKMVFDYETQKADYYVNGTEVYSDYDFFRLNSASGIGKIMFGATEKTGTIANIRNLIIKGTDVEETVTEAFTFEKTAAELGENAKIKAVFTNTSTGALSAETEIGELGTSFSGQGGANVAVVITGIKAGYSVMSCVIE